MEKVDGFLQLGTKSKCYVPSCTAGDVACVKLTGLTKAGKELHLADVWTCPKHEMMIDFEMANGTRKPLLSVFE